MVGSCGQGFMPKVTQSPLSGSLRIAWRVCKLSPPSPASADPAPHNQMAADAPASRVITEDLRETLMAAPLHLELIALHLLGRAYLNLSNSSTKS
jgi:hypothetical protein